MCTIPNKVKLKKSLPNDASAPSGRFEKRDVETVRAVSTMVRMLPRHRASWNSPFVSVKWRPNRSDTGTKFRDPWAGHSAVNLTWNEGKGDILGN